MYQRAITQLQSKIKRFACFLQGLGFQSEARILYAQDLETMHVVDEIEQRIGALHEVDLEDATAGDFATVVYEIKDIRQQILSIQRRFLTIGRIPEELDSKLKDFQQQLTDIEAFAAEYRDIVQPKPMTLATFEKRCKRVLDKLGFDEGYIKYLPEPRGAGGTIYKLDSNIFASLPEALKIVLRFIHLIADYGTEEEIARINWNQIMGDLIGHQLSALSLSTNISEKAVKLVPNIIKAAQARAKIRLQHGITDGGVLTFFTQHEESKAELERLEAQKKLQTAIKQRGKTFKQQFGDKTAKTLGKVTSDSIDLAYSDPREDKRHMRSLKALRAQLDCKPRLLEQLVVLTHPAFTNLPYLTSGTTNRLAALERYQQYRDKQANNVTRRARQIIDEVPKAIAGLFSGTYETASKTITEKLSDVAAQESISDYSYSDNNAIASLVGVDLDRHLRRFIQHAPNERIFSVDLSPAAIAQQILMNEQMTKDESDLAIPSTNIRHGLFTDHLALLARQNVRMTDIDYDGIAAFNAQYQCLCEALANPIIGGDLKRLDFYVFEAPPHGISMAGPTVFNAAVKRIMGGVEHFNDTMEQYKGLIKAGQTSSMRQHDIPYRYTDIKKTMQKKQEKNGKPPSESWVTLAQHINDLSFIEQQLVYIPYLVNQLFAQNGAPYVADLVFRAPYLSKGQGQDYMGALTFNVRPRKDEEDLNDVHKANLSVPMTVRRDMCIAQDKETITGDRKWHITQLAARARRRLILIVQ